MIKARCFFPCKAQADYTCEDEDLLLGAVGTVAGDVHHPYFGIFVSLKYSEVDRHILERNPGLGKLLDEMMVCGCKLRLLGCHKIFIVEELTRKE